MTMDCGYTALADMSDGGVGSFLCLFTPGEAERQVVLYGEEGTVVASYTGGTVQRGDDDAPWPLPIAPEDEVPPDVRLGQHVWNRLVADFVAAIRRGDVAHASVPRLPRFADGLRVQELVAAVERSHAEERWVPIAEFGRQGG
jgi:predicted dehydrogenase